ncbi:M20 family metallo-hydrolase [Salinicoccus halitifaciens]|uniref:N-carbamoyl-L-amino-acid hydrolase n=1 Tax=Salinicoccus halitifaciens TaxID=1073415 RepID=A0ABV2E8I3_9STAP|nr:M20 family metallo-hydrolase [Salinicoccus halitifaciens]MCD2137855.1 M20 family metallo-hydrolase [Salinicoccus halitifaciens]
MEDINKELEIDFNRFLANLNNSSEIGKVYETGLNRLALTDEDKKMRDVFTEYLRNLGLSVRVDDVGNIYGRKEGEENLAPVVVGSHLDTQPNGGRYDGIAGVLLGLEVIETLLENGIKTKRPIEVVNFTNEEGARFSPPMMASGVLSGEFTRDYVYSTKDKDGLSFGDELERIGYKGRKENRLAEIHSYVEAHIEQGPILADENLDVGIVTGIQGTSWFEIAVEGDSNHAGTTPMEVRRDPMLAVAEIIHRLEGLAKEKAVKLTIGKFLAEPNVPNVIPKKVKYTVDVRADENYLREEFIEAMKETVEAVSHDRAVNAEIHELWESPTVKFDEEIIKLITDNSNASGYKSRKIISGAGHDARYINDIAPAAMIFMPSEAGISHDIKEHTEEKYLNICGNLLLKVILELANK